MNAGAAPLAGDAAERPFLEPWQARIFALVTRMCEDGRYDWDAFKDLLIDEIERHGAPDGSDYYERWLAACERLVTGAGFVEAAELARRKAELAAHPAPSDERRAGAAHGRSTAPDVTTTKAVPAEQALRELVEAARADDAGRVAHLKHALLRDEDDFSGLRRIAVALMRGGLIRQAIEAQVACVNAERRLRRRLADDENLLVAMMLMLGDAPSAARFGQEITRTWPDYTPGWENYAFAITQTGNLEAGVEAYRRVLELAPERINAVDGLARCLGGLGRHDESIICGRRSLEAKAEAALALPRVWTMPETPPPPFDPSRPERNVISYSLWGNNPRYLDTARHNARIACDLYPGWTCHFHHDDTVPAETLEALGAAGAVLHAMPRHIAMEGLMWRFLVADAPDVDRFLVRDADSLLTVQERVAVDDWIASGKRFHMMRDWYSHTDLILAGLWDGCGGVLTGIADHIDRFVAASDLVDRKLDQRFLADVVWPSIRDDAVTHDGYFGCFGAVPFPPWGRLPPGHHVGQNAAVHARTRP